MAATKRRTLARPEARPVSTTTERREALRVALIAAAERAIARGGLKALNARDLALEVGCSLGAIYNVFPHLDAIIFEVNSRTLALFEAFFARRHGSLDALGGTDAGEALVKLAETYLAFAVEHGRRWRALFEHSLSEAEGLPKSYLDDQARLFALVERPIAALRPDFTDEQRVLFARTLFAAVHGVISLSIEERLLSLPVDRVGDQLSLLVRSIAVGLARGQRRPASEITPRR